MTRHTGIVLLPPNTSAVERALSLVSAEHRDLIPWDDLPKVFDPFQCPARLLPWLATVFSLDVWFDRWSETKKRETIGRAIELHRIKGTLKGLEEYVALVDGRVASTVTPPALFFTSDFDEAAYQAWLRRLPEFRIYHWIINLAGELCGSLSEPDGSSYAEEEVVLDELIERFAAFGDDTDDEGVAGGFCLTDDSAFPVRSGVRAVLIQDGAEIQCDLEQANDNDARKQGIVADAERVFFPERAGDGLYLSTAGDLDATTDLSFADDAYLHDGSDRHYAAFVLRTGQPAIDINGILTRGRKSIDSDPVRIHLDVDTSFEWYLDDPASEAFLSSGRDVVFGYYDSWRVLDPRVGADLGPAFSFLDHDRFSLAAYTAEAIIDLPEPQIRDQWFLDNGPLGHLWESDFQPLWDVCDAVVTATAARDVVLLDLDYAVRPSLRRTYSFKDMRL